MTGKQMILMGIDPGYAIVGYSFFEYSPDTFRFRVLNYGVITTDKSRSWQERFLEIGENILFLIEKNKPEICAIEKLFFFKNQKTVMQVSEVRGAITMIFLQRSIPVFQYTPLEIKLAIASYGRATKQQVQYMVKTLCNLEETPKPDDAADALAVGITHIMKLKGNCLTDNALNQEADRQADPE